MEVGGLARLRLRRRQLDRLRGRCAVPRWPPQRWQGPLTHRLGEPTRTVEPVRVAERQRGTCRATRSTPVLLVSDQLATRTHLYVRHDARRPSSGARRIHRRGILRSHAGRHRRRRRARRAGRRRADPASDGRSSTTPSARTRSVVPRVPRRRQALGGPRSRRIGRRRVLRWADVVILSVDGDPERRSHSANASPRCRRARSWSRQRFRSDRALRTLAELGPRRLGLGWISLREWRSGTPSAPGRRAVGLDAHRRDGRRRCRRRPHRRRADGAGQLVDVGNMEAIASATSGA